jgi:methylmalonyl-CoA mutase
LRQNIIPICCREKLPSTPSGNPKEIYSMDQTIKGKRLFSEFQPVSTQDWETKIFEDLKGADYDKKLIWRTEEGFSVKPYYRSQDLEQLKWLEGMPGHFPFTRGTHGGGNSWLIRQDIDSAEPEIANAEAADAISRGATAIGFDTSKIHSASGFRLLFQNIDLSKVSIHLHSAASYSKLLDYLDEYLKASNFDTLQLKGSFDFDPISYALLYGRFYVSPEKNMTEAMALVNRANIAFPGLRVLSVNGSFLRNAGATAVQELAFSLASANEYLVALSDKGLDIAKVAPHIQFSFCTGSSYFIEIARLRAARLLWAHIVKQYHPESDDSAKMFIHSSPSGWNKTIYDPYVNLLRSTTEAMSAALGGTDSMSIDPFDIFYKESDEFSKRISRNQQIILKEESYLDKVVDPSAGSYYIENLTASIANAAWALFLNVEEKGGMVQAIHAGYVQEEVEKAADQKQNDVASRRTIVLGTNHHPNPGEFMLDKIQSETLTNETEEDTPGPIRKLNLHRMSDAFEDLRLATEMHVDAGNKRPAVFMLTMGNLAMRKARAAFSSNFFGCAGYQIIDNNGFETTDEAIKAALASEAEIVVVCSSDEEYAAIVPVLTLGIKKANPGINLLVAGSPKDIMEQLKTAGVDDFVHLRTNLLDFLQKMNVKLGIMTQV